MMVYTEMPFNRLEMATRQYDMTYSAMSGSGIRRIEREAEAALITQRSILRQISNIAVPNNGSIIGVGRSGRTAERSKPIFAVNEEAPQIDKRYLDPNFIFREELTVMLKKYLGMPPNKKTAKYLLSDIAEIITRFVPKALNLAFRFDIEGKGTEGFSITVEPENEETKEHLNKLGLKL